MNKEVPTDTSYLRTHAETRGFSLGRPTWTQPTPDGKAVLFLRAHARVPRLGLYEFDVASGATRERLTPEQLLRGAEEPLSPEEKARREPGAPWADGSALAASPAFSSRRTGRCCCSRSAASST